MKRWEKIITALGIAIVLYFTTCFCEINNHNRTDKQYSDWNIFAHGFEWAESLSNIN